MSAMPDFRRLSLSEFIQVLHAFPFRRRINAVHMHHTFRPNHAQYNADPKRAIEGMWRFHTQTRGFSHIAQHITIGTGGEIWTGRHWDLPPASAAGHNGNRTAGPFMFETIGDFDHGNDRLEGAQLESVLEVIAAVQRRFGLAPEALRFHNEMAAKSCPGTGVSRQEMIERISVVHARMAQAESARNASVFGPEADRARETVLKISEIFFDRAEDDSRSFSHDEELDEAEMTFEQERALEDAIVGGTRSASRGGELSPSDLDRLRGHVINLRFGQLSSAGKYRNTQADVERIFREDIPTAMARATGPFRVLFWAHGGLVSETRGLQGALQQ
ncbi:MAG TPA: N-acetylmuramoyl-L-alanine amidase, partial [Bryobacteraceae bacterium]|nr:N-acetylmuramoyl-L-alanine amidase [Bryobacteraceae bacterium]